MRSLTRIVVLLPLVACIGATPAPEPSPSADPLTEIGRVRAVTPACALIRDLVTPSIEAARRADARFRETGARDLMAYARAFSETYLYAGVTKWNTGDVAIEAAIHQMGRDNAAMARDAKQIADALGDRRFASDDAGVARVKAALEAVYQIERDRLAQLTAMELRVNRTEMKKIDPITAFSGGSVVPPPPPTPNPYATTLPGMPVLRGLADNGEVERMRDWARQVDRVTSAQHDTALTAIAEVTIPCR